MANKLFQPDLDRAVHSGCFGLDLFGDFALRAPDGALVRGLSRKARGLIAISPSLGIAFRGTN